MQGLAVFGWDDELQPLLRRLEQHASLRALAIGDPSATQLVRARGATGLPCSQHLTEMARTIDYDAALISDPAIAAEISDEAASRDADLLVIGDRMDAAALRSAATAAARHGVALAVLRPALRCAGYAFLTGLIAADDRWQPRFINLELRGDRPAPALLRDAVAAAARLLPEAPETVTVSAAGRDEEPEALVAHLRLPDGALASVTARRAPAERMLLSTSAPAGSTDLVSAGSETELSVHPRGGASESSHLPGRDPDELEAARASAVRRGEAPDTLLAHRDAATLLAVEASLASGQTAAVRPPTTRAALRVLEGGRQTASTPATGRLQVVTT